MRARKSKAGARARFLSFFPDGANESESVWEAGGGVDQTSYLFFRVDLNMFRHVGSISGRAAAAGVAAAAGGAASTSTAQCRAETVTTPTSGAEARAKVSGRGARRGKLCVREEARGRAPAGSHFRPRTTRTRAHSIGRRACWWCNHLGWMPCMAGGERKKRRAVLFDGRPSRTRSLVVLSNSRLPPTSHTHIHQTPSHPTPSNAWGSVPDDWVDAAAVAISDADVAEAVQSVLHVVSPPSDAPPASSVSVRELGATSDEEGTPAGVASPTAAMAAADAQLALLQTNAAVRADFESALTSLLSNSEVRTACARALAADPAFAGLLRTVGAQADLPVDSFLPLAARVAARLPTAAVTGSPGGPADPLAAFFDALADGLVCLGKDISGVAGAVGKIAIDAGYRIHRLVSAPFGSTPHYLAGPDGGSSHRPRRPCADAPLGSPEFWKDVLTTVACVVVSVLLVKRLPRGRPAV